MPVSKQISQNLLPQRDPSDYLQGFVELRANDNAPPVDARFNSISGINDNDGDDKIPIVARDSLDEPQKTILDSTTINYFDSPRLGEAGNISIGNAKELRPNSSV